MIVWVRTDSSSGEGEERRGEERKELERTGNELYP
jgi:hypothetical protein